MPLLALFTKSQKDDFDLADETEVIRKIEAVAALGQLQPSGEVRRLAAPSSSFGGTPRVLKLKVEEGDEVVRGQVLAVFDNQPRILADLGVFRARKETIQIQILIKQKELIRYEKAAKEGATALVVLDEKRNQLASLNGSLKEVSAEILGLEADLVDSELKAPIDGVILRIHTQVGERSSNQGVLEVGANKEMEALIEVYESDVNRIRLDQQVVLTSENGGFIGNIYGRVMRISPQVRQRKVLSTDPTGDADARVVEVRIRLDKDSAIKVSQLTGMKVIARFQEL